jgi:uncharacterized membrane protein YdjX (TVP38/TMEM64 family)
VEQWLYHALFGVKFLIALLGVFPLAIMLTAGGDRFAAVKANAKTWMAVLVALAVVVVLISGFLRLMPTQRAEQAVITLSEVPFDAD